MVQNSPSKYFNNYNYQPRQRLLEDLVIQAIRMNGLLVKYLPRENTNRDTIMGEDLMSKFQTAFVLEAYPKNVDAFEGEGDVLSKFGLEIRDQMTLTVARKRWQQLSTEKLVTEVGLPYEDEELGTWQSSKNINYILESEIAENYNVDLSEPRPGDLIYLPMTQTIFEITFVEREQLFYQHGVLLTYDLKCELFKYSSEEFDTNDDDINALDDLLSLNLDNWTIRTENFDGELLYEDGTNIVQEETATDLAGDNDDFEKEGGEIVNFDDMSPFIKVKEW